MESDVDRKKAEPGFDFRRDREGRYRNFEGNSRLGVLSDAVDGSRRVKHVADMPTAAQPLSPAREPHVAPLQPLVERQLLRRDVASLTRYALP